MNEGARLDEILHTVEAPSHLLRAALPGPGLRRAGVHRAQHLAALRRLVRRRPFEPQASAPEKLASELASLAGGAGVLAERALALAEAAKNARRLRAARPGTSAPGTARTFPDELRIAGHLAEMAVLADPARSGHPPGPRRGLLPHGARRHLDDGEGDLPLGRHRSRLTRLRPGVELLGHVSRGVTSASGPDRPLRNYLASAWLASVDPVKPPPEPSGAAHDEPAAGRRTTLTAARGSSTARGRNPGPRRVVLGRSATCSRPSGAIGAARPRVTIPSS